METLHEIILPSTKTRAPSDENVLLISHLHKSNLFSDLFKGTVYLKFDLIFIIWLIWYHIVQKDTKKVTYQPTEGAKQIYTFNFKQVIKGNKPVMCLPDVEATPEK